MSYELKNVWNKTDNVLLVDYKSESQLQSIMERDSDGVYFYTSEGWAVGVVGKNYLLVIPRLNCREEIVNSYSGSHRLYIKDMEDLTMLDSALKRLQLLGIGIYGAYSSESKGQNDFTIYCFGDKNSLVSGESRHKQIKAETMDLTKAITESKEVLERSKENG